MATQNTINGRSGTVINKVSTTSFSPETTMAGIIGPNGVPTTSNLTELTSLTISAESSTNVLMFNFNATVSANATGLIICLFQGTTLLNSIGCPMSGSASTLTAYMLYQQAAGTTSSTTYSIYYGNVSYPGPYVNNINITGNGGTLGSSLSYTFTITEEIA